jgi:hypothetical protein
VTCPEGVHDVAAYVLGALEPDERVRLEAHLRGCPVCAAELQEFRALPALLDRVRHEELPPVGVAPSADLFDRLSAAAAPPVRRRARTWALVAAAVLVVLGVGVAVRGEGDAEQVVAAAAGPVRASVTASADDDGSALVVTVAGLRPGEECRMLAVDTDGTRHEAGSWPASPAGDGTWRGWADVDRADLAEVVLVGAGGRELVRLDF